MNSIALEGGRETIVDESIKAEIIKLLNEAVGGPETIAIAKDEYIALLQCKVARLESERQPGFTPRAEPHSWMNEAEIAEIMRLKAEGVRSGEIAQRVKRPCSTIRRCIRQRTQLLRKEVN